MNEYLQKINGIRFEGIDDLYIKKGFIKSEFKKMSIECKELYKLYFFYQLCICKYKIKSVFWDYIINLEENDDELFEIVNITYIDLRLKKENMFKKLDD